MPANEDVQLTFTIDDAEAQRAWEKFAQGPQKAEEALKKLHDQSEHTGHGIGSVLDHTVGKWLTLHAAIHEAIHLIREYHEEMMKMRDEEAGAFQTTDKAMRPLFAALKLAEPGEQQELQDAISRIAIQKTVSIPRAAKSAASLARYGATQEQILGGDLEALLNYEKAASIAGQTPDSDQILKALYRSKRGITPDAIAGLGAQMVAYTGRIAGFGPQTVEDYAKYAGLMGSDPEALGIYAELATQYEPKQIKKKITELYSSRPSGGARRQLAELRDRLHADTGQANPAEEYHKAIEIEDQSIGSKIEQGEALLMYQRAKSGERLTRAQRLERFESLYRNAGASNLDIWIKDKRLWLESWNGEDSENELMGTFIAEQRVMSGKAGSRNPKEIAEIISGQRDITIKLQGHDGRDIPHEPAAGALNH